MKRIKKRKPLNTLESQIRHSYSSLGHIVYYCILAVFAGIFIWYLMGDRVFLSADGVVEQEHLKIEAPATLTVADMYVQPGTEVLMNQPIMRIQMPDTQLQLAQVGERIGSLKLEQKRALQARDMARRQLPILRDQVSTLEQQIERKEELLSRGLYNINSVEQQKLRLAELKKEVARLQVQSKVKENGEHFEELQRFYASLKRIFGDGVIRSPVTGYVGKTNVQTGTVATTGELLLDVIYGQKFVVAYLSNDYLFELKVGQKVHVKGKHVDVEGEISSFLPFSETLPDEFQDKMTAHGRSLLARIDVRDTRDLVMNQAVVISIDSSPMKTIRRKINEGYKYVKELF